MEHLKIYKNIIVYINFFFFSNKDFTLFIFLGFYFLGKGMFKWTNGNIYEGISTK